MIKAERLAEHQAVEIPTQSHGKHPLQDLQAEGGCEKCPNHQHHHQHAHANECQAFFGKQCFRRIAAEPIDDFADKLKQQGFANADAAGEQRQQYKPAAHAFKIAPNKAKQPVARGFRLAGRIGIDAVFKPGE